MLRTLPISIQLNRLDPTRAGIIVEISKLKADVSDIQKKLEQETAANNEVHTSVAKLTVDVVEVKEFIAKNVSDPNNATKTWQQLMKRLPCKSLDDLDWLLAYITNRSLHWTEYIKLIGGTDFNSAMKIIINATMNRSVQKQLSWSGIRSKKPSLKFKYKRIVDGIHVAMAEKFADYTIVRGEAKMQSLLKNAAASK